MGQQCSRLLGGADHGGAQLSRPADGLGLFGNFRPIPQILLIGPPGSGKTTLLYSSFLPGWQSISGEIEPTKGFHYEELRIPRYGPLGVWDVSGSLPDIWPIFYRYVRVAALVFVVSISDSNDEALVFSRRWIRSLLNEDELREAHVVVVMNSFDLGPDSLTGEDELASRLGLARTPRSDLVRNGRVHPLDRQGAAAAPPGPHGRRAGPRQPPPSPPGGESGGGPRGRPGRQQRRGGSPRPANGVQPEGRVTAPHRIGGFSLTNNVLKALG